MFIKDATKHCAVCNRCCDEFDHHCVWLNNCVGYNNYHLFIGGIICLFIYCFISIAWSILYLVMATPEYWKRPEVYIIIFQLLFYVAIDGYLVTLINLHRYLTQKGITTYTFVKFNMEVRKK